MGTGGEGKFSNKGKKGFFGFFQVFYDFRERPNPIKKLHFPDGCFYGLKFLLFGIVGGPGLYF